MRCMGDVVVAAAKLSWQAWRMFSMAFRVPAFNLSCRVWRRSHLVTATPDVVSPCNLAYERKGQGGGLGYFQIGNPSQGLMYLLLPAKTDIRPAGLYSSNLLEDCVEVPAGSGRFYVVTAVDDVARGFSNEYRCAMLAQANDGLSGSWVNVGTANRGPWDPPAWPAPIP